MIDYRKNRRSNLLELERRHGTLTALSDKTGVPASYLSQLKKFRHMGDRIARRLEKKLNLPEGWMDIAHFPQEVSVSPQEAKVMQAVDKFVPNERVQDFLHGYLALPEALRQHLEAKTQALRAYVEKLTPFQRLNLSQPPPRGSSARVAWERELEREVNEIIQSFYADPLEEAVAGPAPAAGGSKHRKK